MIDEKKLKIIERFVVRLEKVIYDLRGSAPLIANGGHFSHGHGVAIAENAVQGLLDIANDVATVSPEIAGVLSAFASAPNDPSVISNFAASDPILKSKLSELALKASASDPARQTSDFKFGIAVAIAYSADRLDALVDSFGRIYTKEVQPKELSAIIDTINVELIHLLAKKPELLYQLQPRQFEELIAEILASFGWDIALTSSTRDGGYDLFAIAPNYPSDVRTSWLIECKRYSPHKKVGIQVVDALYGVAARLNIPNILIATTSSFTGSVERLQTSRYDLQLKDYYGVLKWIEAYKENRSRKPHFQQNDIVPPKDR